jgi:diguanylate cyclase (GGDEF)-like protein
VSPARGPARLRRRAVSAARCLLAVLATVAVLAGAHLDSHAEPASQAIPPPLPEALAQPRFETVRAAAIPRAVVPAIAEDKAGFLWIATGNGLVRYDGYRFRPQERAHADPARRNLGWIRALLGGSDGRLWIGTEADGLVWYDPVLDRIEDASSSPSAATMASQPTILALAEDLDGGIWSGSRGGGLQWLDPRTGQTRTYRHDAGRPNSLPDNRVGALLMAGDGSLWVGTWAGLSRRRPGSQGFETIALAIPPNAGPGAEPVTVQALLQTSDGRIWVGSAAGDVFRIDPATGASEWLAEVRPNGVSSLLELPGGEVWVGHTAGIDVRVLADGRRLRELRHDPRRADGLAGHHVTQMMIDRAGWVWVGGFGLGLQRHNPHNRSVLMRGADPTPGSALADADVRSLMVLANGDIWAASHTSGLAVLDPALEVKGAVPLPAKAVVQALVAVQTGDGRPPGGWVATQDALMRFTDDRRLLGTVPHRLADVSQLEASPDGTLWIAAGDGLHRLGAGAAETLPVRLQDGHPLPGPAHVLALAPDGALWVGSAFGLHRVAAGSDRLQPVLADGPDGLSSPIVVGLLWDAKGTLWVDTAVAGLHRMRSWDGSKATFEAVSARHGFLNRPFGANLMADRRGRIWTHLNVFDPSTDQLVELTGSDGALTGTGWFGSRARMSDGRMLFGSSKGVLVVMPEDFDVSRYAPALVVSELRVNGMTRPAERLVNGIALGPTDRSLQIEFAALDYGEPERIRYRYRLEGFDPDWVDTGADWRVAAYSNLDPGQYRLRVQATNRSGIWSAEELAVPVEVHPAWWQQPLARAAAVFVSTLLLVLAFGGALQWRTRQLRATEADLQRKVGERTAELQSLTQRLQAQSSALEEMSLTDPLTGLRNRRYLQQVIDADVSIVQRRHEDHRRLGDALPQDADLVFFLFDVDHFKQVNDRHGHAAGDEVLRQMRGRLQRVFRDSDHLVRWGGEEFLVVARGIPRSMAMELAERLRTVIGDEPFVLPDGTRLVRTCSVGFAGYPLNDQSPQSVSWAVAVDAADAALYAVKRSGRDGWLGVLAATAESDAEARDALRDTLVLRRGGSALRMAGSRVFDLDGVNRP